MTLSDHYGKGRNTWVQCARFVPFSRQLYCIRTDDNHYKPPFARTEQPSFVPLKMGGSNGSRRHHYVNHGDR